MPAPTITVCGTAYEVSFDAAGPSLTLTPTGSGSGAVAVSGRLECCGCDFAVFAFGGASICTGERADPGGCSNIFRLKVELDCCPIDGWDGEGWYCTRTAGTADACAAEELLDADRCDDTVEICSGPYATEGAAQAVCGGTPGIPMPCLGRSFAGATAQFVNKTGDCTCLPDSPSVGSAGTDTLTVATASCPGNVGLSLACVAGQYTLTSAGGVTITPVVYSAGPPLVLAWDITGYGANCGGGGGGARLVITLP